MRFGLGLHGIVIDLGCLIDYEQLSPEPGYVVVAVCTHGQVQH